MVLSIDVFKNIFIFIRIVVDPTNLLDKLLYDLIVNLVLRSLLE